MHSNDEQPVIGNLDPPCLAVGQTVRITQGPLEGLLGTFVSAIGQRWTLEVATAGPGVYLRIDPKCCKLIGRTAQQ